MPLSYSDWQEIQQFVTRLLSQQGDFFTQGEVVKSDQENKLVWLKEFGDQPIPCVSFDYQVKYYFQEPTGNTLAAGQPVAKQTAMRKTKPYSKEVEILVPRPGDIVLVAQHMGSRRLPKCLGVIKSKNYVRAEGTD